MVIAIIPDFIIEGDIDTAAEAVIVVDGAEEDD